MDRPHTSPPSSSSSSKVSRPPTEMSTDAAAAAALLLRHRLFPRAMAWNVHQEVTFTRQEGEELEANEHERLGVSGSGSSGVKRAGVFIDQRPTHYQRQFSNENNSESMKATQQIWTKTGNNRHGNNQDYGGSAVSAIPPAAVDEALTFARSFPFLQAAATTTVSANSSTPRSNCSQQGEEKLRIRIRTNSNSSTTTEGSRSRFSSIDSVASFASSSTITQPVVETREDLFRAMGKFLEKNGSVSGQLAFPQQPPQLQQPHPRQSSHHRHRAHGRQSVSPPRVSQAAARMDQHAAFQAMTISSPAHEKDQLSVTQRPPRSPSEASLNGSSSTSTSTSSNKRRQKPQAIAPSLAKALLTGCGAKRCSAGDCSKIAVSKGLCRGHGGGRRCQYTGCSKCAQSRSPYCWAHGGGKRCEAPNCRRSRKTKRFCVDHVDMELTVPLPANLSAAMDSDESPGGSTVASDSDMSSIVVTTEVMQTTSISHQPHVQQFLHQHHQQHQQPPGERTSGMQLPSLNEALQRAFPSKPSGEALLSASLQQREYMWSQGSGTPYQSGFELPKSFQ